MDGLLGYPRQPILSQPPDAVQRLLPRLSQDSLHQLERNAKEPIAAHKASRVRNWVQDLGNPTFGATDRPSQDNFRRSTEGTTQSAGRSDQPTINGYTFVQRPSFLGPITTGHATTSLPDPRSPVIGLTEPSNKRLKLSNHSRPSSQGLDTRVQSSYNSSISRTVPAPQPLNRSNSTSRLSQPATTPTITLPKLPNPVPAKTLPQKDSIIDLTDDQKAKGPQKEDVFKIKIQDVFPDICEGYIKTLYAKYDIKNRTGQSFLVAVQDALDEILAKSSYPKQVSRKRKRDENIDRNDLQRIREDEVFYFPVAYKLLVKSYTSVPHTTIKNLLTQYKTFLKAYVALHYLGRPASDASEYWRRLHSAKDKYPPRFAAVLDHELREAKKVIAEKEGADKKKEEDAIEKIIEEEHRLAGTLVECQCCFAEVLPDRTVPCDGDEIHLFCNSCVKHKAEVQVGLMQYELKCFDTSGCQAGFSIKLVRKVIGDKLMKRLEDLQQQDEIAKASIDGLEECPFCEFKAICPPVEQNKEFTCLNSDCEKVSCRLCKEDTHIPQTCEEAKKERGLEVRHTVEEAMTAALIRKCPKCGLSIVKEDGCNKLRCRCGALICDVCKKDISKEGYMHFQVGTSTCNLHEGDTGLRRRMNEVMQAEKAAMAEVLAQDDKLDPEMLRVTSKPEESVNQQVPAQRGMPVNVNRPRPQMPPMPQMLQMPPMPRVPPMPQVPQFHLLNVAQIRQVPQIPQVHRAPPAARPTVPRAAPMPEFPQIPRLALAPGLPLEPGLPQLLLFHGAPEVLTTPMRTMSQTQARQAPRTGTPTMPTARLLTNPATATQPQRSVTTTALRTTTPAIPMARLPTTQQRQTSTVATATASILTPIRRQPYGQAPSQPRQLQAIPPPLQRTNSTPIPQLRQQPPQQPHQHHHFLRRRSGNH